MAEVAIVDNQDATDGLVVAHNLALVRANPATTFGLGTGSIPLSVYRSIASQVASGGVDLSLVRGFTFDE